MNDVSRPCDTYPDLVSLKYPLPHLKAALQQQRKVRIVAIGSSSTAGVVPVLPPVLPLVSPYPPRLETLLRKKFYGRIIDVINRGIGGQEAPEEISRFEPDIFDEAPALVIWQVGTNAIYHDYNRAEVTEAIKVGLQWLADFPADVVLMDLQYTRAMVEKLEASEDMESRIAATTAEASVNVFRRFALMKQWVRDGISIEALDDGEKLHTGEWATRCVTQALYEAIVQAVQAEPTT
jgi:lysophospholipase L1-like esterase